MDTGHGSGIVTVETRKVALYRAFGVAGTLLYVGVTVDPAQRWRHHAAEKPWWAEVASTTVEWHPTEVAARQAEAAAVRGERPAYNRTLPAEDGSPRFRHTAPHLPCARARQLGSPLRRFRVDDELWEAFKDAVERSPDPEADMSMVLRQMLRWYVSNPGAKLPERPAAPAG